MSNLPYSYHTFLFPFIWNNRGDTSWDDFEKVLSIGKRWKSVDWHKDEIPNDCSDEEWCLNYAAFQYFTEPANNILFNTRGDNVVQCFEYWNNGKKVTGDGRYKYIISKKYCTYSLIINKIQLYIYDAGIAVLIFELENYDCKSLDDVNAINEHGRRINLPYLTPGNPHYLCADKIELSFDSEIFACEDYLQTLNDLTNFKDSKNKISLNYIMKPIQKLLDGDGKDNGGYEVTSNFSHKGTRKPFIKPCIDDRMFVCCLVRDAKISEQIRIKNKDEDFSFLSGWNEREKDGEASNYSLANKLYKLAYIENSVTCQNTHMKKDLMLESFYRRWSDCGTLYAVTHHSIVCITSDDSYLEDPVVNPFLNIYVKLAVMTIVQRSAILSLSSEAAKVSDNFKSGSDISLARIKEIEQLQAKYVKIQNQLFLTETTVQEQGVEIYELLYEQLYIDRNRNALNEQIGNLRDVADISNSRIERKSDNLLNRNLVIISIFAVPFTVIQTIPVLADSSISCLCKIIGGVAAGIASLAAICIFRETFKKK